MSKRRPIIITQWATQTGRRRAALAPGYVGIDERSLPELLAFAPSFARHVRYIDTEGRPDGDWSDFFLADSAMLLASMAVFDGARRSHQFHEACRAVQSENVDALKFERLKALFNTILALASKVEAWRTTAMKLSDGPGDALRNLLMSTISRELAPLLSRLRAYGFGAGQPGALGQPIPDRCHHFHPIWQTRYVCPNGSIYRGHFRRKKINAALGPLSELHESLLGAISDLTERARRDLTSGLANGRHKPHLALYIAFIKQFQIAQERLNELPARVVDFYYRDVLREQLRASKPDQMFLSFTRAPGTSAVGVVRGARFPGGTDATGKPIVFAADQTLNVTEARLVRARATRAIRGPLWHRVADDSSRLSARNLHVIVTNNVLVDPNGTFAEGRPWAPFPAPAVGTINEKLQQAPLGFAVSSASLLLTGGHRNLKISLRSNAQFHDAVLGPKLRQIANVTGLSSEQTLSQIAAKAFRFSSTTPQGWLEIASGNVTASQSKEEGWNISFEFEMPPDTPAFVAPTLPLTNEQPQLAGYAPTLIARLRQDPIALGSNGNIVEVYPLSLLEGFPVENIEIRTQVIDLPGVKIKARAGPVDAAAPFMPFGTPARAGAWFDIRHRELFAKPLDQLTVSINWLNLPSHPRGFAGYYEQYHVGPDRQSGLPCITNDSFRIVPTLEGAAPWTFVIDNAPETLFRTKETPGATSPAGTLDPTTIVTLMVRPSAGVPPQNSSDVSLRFTLSDPFFGFGDELYSPNVLYALHSIQAPPPVKRRRFLCRLVDFFFRRKVAATIPPEVTALYPNPPWQPEIASISVGYTSTDQLDVRGDQAWQFLHLMPTGALAPATPTKPGVVSLLPNVSENAQLDLGFTGLGAAQTLTLLLRMTGEGHVADYSGVVKWRAKTSDGWTTVETEAVHNDGSDRFRHSGIVSLDLPVTAADANSEGLYWIRAEPQHDPENFPAIIAITPHAITATRIVGPDSGAEEPVPPKTVKAAAPPIAGVVTIDQPIASFGGQPAESPETLPIRLGERLRHKERTCLSWDYERLVLERFPEITKVRVLPAHNAAGSHKPGELVVVVVPGPRDIYATDMLMPRTSADTRGRIQASLQAATNPFVHLHVVDPVYLRVTVRADVIFREDQSGHGPTQLTDDLCVFLSPWSHGLNLPNEAGPGDVHEALANFIATRNYVAGLVTLELGFEPAPNTLNWCVLTSAINHDIRIAPHRSAPPRFRPPVHIASKEYAYDL
jgi:hypothetical protein